MQNRMFLNVISVPIFVFLLATFVNGQSVEPREYRRSDAIEHGYTVAIRTVSEEPNLYVTASGSCGPGVTIQPRIGEKEQQVGQDQVVEIVDLDGGALKYGDKIRIRRCDNYLRADSEKNVSSTLPNNGIPDSATVFTILEPPDPGLKTQPGFFVLIHSENNGLFVSAPKGETNGLGQHLQVSSDWVGNPRNVFKLIPLTYQLNSTERIVGGLVRDRDEAEGRIRDSQSGGADRRPASGAKRTIDFVEKLITDHNEELDEAERHIRNTDRQGTDKKNKDIEPRPKPSDKP